MQPFDRERLIRLREILTTRFDDGELQNLCFDLEIDYESLPGTGKANKVREIVAYCERRNRLDDLCARLQHMRPDIAWEDSSGTSADTPAETRESSSTPLQPVALPQVFVSYSRKNHDVVDQLVQQLRARGLRVWRDLDNIDLGRSTVDTIRNALATVDAAIIYVTQESLQSDYIRNLELPAVLERFEHDPTFPIIPLFAGVTPEEGDRATRTTRARLSDFNAVFLSPNDDPAMRSDKIADVAGRTVRSILSPYLRNADPHTSVGIVISSYQEQYNQHALVHLDWVNFFQPSLPSKELWQQTLLPALGDLMRVITQHGNTSLKVWPKAHLSIGYALGYTFPRVANFSFEIEQPTDTQTQWWRSDEPDAKGQRLKKGEILGDEQAGSDMTLEVSMTQDVGPDVADWIEQSGITLRKRVTLMPPRGPSRTFVKGSVHAQTLVRQIEKEVLAQRRSEKKATIHLFGAMPFALAVFIGTRLNACGPIQCYEYHKTAKAYKIACLLP